MVAYSGKQFWNEFNNWDEGLFQDASRPRDWDKFKVLQGINTRKQDLRTANSWIAAQATFRSITMLAWQPSIIWTTPYMKNKFSASDISEIEGFVNTSWYWYGDLNAVAADLWSVIIGRPYANTKDWDIVIGKWWVYAITCACVFYAPYSSISKILSQSFWPWCAAYYKFYVAFLLNWKQSMRTQGRRCWSIDNHNVFYVGWLDVGDRVNIWMSHTNSEDIFLCQPSINLYRLS